MGLNDLIQEANGFGALTVGEEPPCFFHGRPLCHSQRAQTSNARIREIMAPPILHPRDSGTLGHANQMVAAGGEGLGLPSGIDLNVARVTGPSPKCSRVSLADRYDDWLSTSSSAPCRRNVP